MPLTKTNLGRTLSAALVLASIGACGPESREKSDWMYDTFSAARTAGEIFTASGLAKYTFEDGGVGHLRHLNACGRDESVRIFTWEQRDDGALAILPEEGEERVFGSSADEWRFSRTGGCAKAGGDEVRRYEFLEGEQLSSSYLLYRGDLCLERFACSDTEGDSQCDDCRTYWCDAPPPECSDE